MSEEFYGKSIPITSGFDLGAKSPLDTRSIVNTIEERNAHVIGNRVYEGMKVYVLAEKKEYRYNGNDWEEVGGITDEQLEKLTIAYEHSQTPHVTETDLNSKVDKVEGKSLISDTEIERLANVDNYDDTEIRAELNNKANISDLHQHANKEALDGITADKVTSWDNKSDFDGDYNSLTNKPTIPSKTSELVNDSTYVTESGVLEIIENSGGIGGATEVSQGETEPTEESVLLWIDTTSDENMVENNLSNSLITEFQGSISTLNTRISTLEKNIEPPFGEDAHTHSNKVVLDKITQSYFDKWNNKSDFNGSYNSLTDKPTIPTRTSELINNSNYVTTAEMNQAIADIPIGEQVDLTNYQTKTDNTLNTTNKTVIGAINEVNTNLNNKVGSSELNTAISSYVTANREELKGDKGDKGDIGATGQDGVTPTLSVGTTTTGVAGSNASVSMEGSSPNYTLNFTIPKGDKGDKGDVGAKGQDGVTPTLSIGTVTTGNAGSNASVTMTGSSPNYTLNFTIPKGDKGDSGSGGNADLTNYQTKTDNTLNTTDKTIVGAINEINTLLGKCLPFENSYVSNCNTWLTNGYTKTNTSTTNHPSVCTGADRWGILFFIAENAANGTGTQMYFPIDGTYKGAIFTRSITNRSPEEWKKLATISDIPTSLPANGGNANTVGGYTIWTGTQSEYDAISSKSSTTIYFIKG